MDPRQPVQLLASVEEIAVRSMRWTQITATPRADAPPNTVWTTK